MKAKPKILFASFEATPFIKTGGLGDVAGSLPKALNACGANTRLIMPKFGTIPEKYKERMTHVADFYMDLGWRHMFCGVETLKTGGVTCYFIDNEYYFRRDRAYGYNDDDERIAFFSKAVLECLKYLPDFFPKIIHCNDWHTGLIPCFLKEWYSGREDYAQIRTVMTVHNLRFQGIFGRSRVQDVLGMSDESAGYCGLVYEDTVNYLRGGLCMADLLSTVSPTYAEEICTDFFGENLQEIFRSRHDALYGILNGIDIKSYDPAADKLIYTKFSSETCEKKRENKEALQADLGLPVNGDIPLIVLVSRLTQQKGLDLVTAIVHELLNENVQLAVIGVGDSKYEEMFNALQWARPDKCAVRIAFDEPLSRKFYAAADMTLIPSLFEPCGLTQMISMRYGALPIVRETGGLKDSVTPYNKFTGEGNGFSFLNYNAHELLFTCKEAVNLYHNDRPAWDALVQNAMDEDFSWTASAKQYFEMYKRLLDE